MCIIRKINIVCILNNISFNNKLNTIIISSMFSVFVYIFYFLIFLIFPINSSKNKLQQIQLSDTTGSSNGTGFYGQMKLKKNRFLASNQTDEFSTNRSKKVPNVHV